MFKTKCLSPVWILFLIFCISAISQQPLTQGQIRHVNKVMKSLARFDAGTRLDVQLSDGFHHIGTLNESGPTTFVLVDSIANKSQTFDYLDVKRVKPSRNSQPGKSRGISYPAVDIIAISFAVLTILVVKSM
jgi:hypothetical protein